MNLTDPRMIHIIIIFVAILVELQYSKLLIVHTKNMLVRNPLYYNCIISTLQ